MAKRTPPPPITDSVAEDAIRRLHDALKKSGRRDLVRTLLLEVTRNYIYVADGQGGPLCRLRHTGDPDYWVLHMFKWSSERYDTRNDFGFGGGTLHDCVDALLRGYRL